MHTLSCSVAALAVASIYYTYRAYAVDRARRERCLRERVAYLLWAMASQMR